MPGPHTHRHVLLDGKNEFARVCTKKNSTFLLSLVFFRANTPTFAQTPTWVLGLPGMYIHIDLQKTTKLALKLFVQSWEHGQL